MLFFITPTYRDLNLATILRFPLSVLGFMLLPLFSACTTGVLPLQHLSEARAAIDAAEALIGPCPCAELEPAQEAYRRAQTLSTKHAYSAASHAALEALHAAQDVIRAQQ